MGYKRPILISLGSQIRRQEISRSGKKVKGTGIVITEDLTEEELKDMKILLAALKKLEQLTKLHILEGTSSSKVKHTRQKISKTPKNLKTTIITNSGKKNKEDILVKEVKKASHKENPIVAEIKKSKEEPKKTARRGAIALTSTSDSPKKL
ncbi:hypothetical protein JTB14_015446 [Gonioctena quinquepunctata]|nr:hypothetical protein JTB14_015446 [Gonioctena quinquepunctata]